MSNLRAFALGLSVVLASAALAAAEEPSTPVGDVTALNNLLAQIAAEAAVWAGDDKADDVPATALLKDVYPTEANLAWLSGELGKVQSKNHAEDLFIRFQLLQPLRQASTASLRKLIGSAERLGTAAKYEPLPQYTNAQLERLRMPAPGDATPDQVKRIQAEQAKKLAADRSVIRNNMLVRRIQRTAMELHLLADQPQADQDIIKTLTNDADKGLVTYTDALAMIDARVTELNATRAKMFYDALKALLAKAGNKTADFTDPAKANYEPERNSTFATEHRMPGADLANVINVLATAARQPAVEVPKAADNNRPRPGGRAPRGG
jgi:hypothetical protein